MSYSEFDAHFDRFEVSTFRLETLQQYAVSEDDASYLAFKYGRPQPERSVRTSSWLARMATTSIAGKRWSRVHIVEHPLSVYLKYELAAYVESAVAGEMISIADRAADADLADLRSDFWLFDAETSGAFALLMRYDENGHWLGYDYADDAVALDRCRRERDLALAHAASLNVYLAGRGILTA